MISYCIPVCNESKELSLLLNQLIPRLREGDEIVVQGDQGNVTSEVVSVISPLLRRGQISYVEYPLNNDFSTFKNNLIKNAKNSWIFQVDADELVSETLLDNIHWLLNNNPEIDGYALPRVNLVNGLTPEWIKKWGWHISKGVVQQEDEATINVLNLYGIDIFAGSLKLVNYPDYQCRIFRTDRGVRWINKVHERLVSTGGAKNLNVPLPCSEGGDVVFDYCLFHVKDINRQIKQNEMYSKIV